MSSRRRHLTRCSTAHSVHPILDITGGVFIGGAGNRVITGTLAAAEAHGLPVERLTRAEVAARFPQHQNLGYDVVGVWDPDAGVAYPETAVVAAVRAARAAGAEIQVDTRVTAVDLVDGGAVVRTDADSFTVRQVVVTAGAWLDKLVPGLDLNPTRTTMTWFEPADPADDSFALARFPVFIRALGRDNGIWGHGAADGLDPTPVRAVTCMMTHSPDGQFVIGRPGGDPRLVVGGGGSGHAFKHAGGIGEILAQLVTGEPTYVDTAFMSPNRLHRRGGNRAP